MDRYRTKREREGEQHGETTKWLMVYRFCVDA